MKAFTLAALAALAVALPCAAEPVARDEAGTVEFQLREPQGFAERASINPGDAVWADMLRPAHLVRLTGDGVERVRPGRTPGSPAGTLLYGYNLSSGMAYCPPLTRGDNAQRVQCLRDFDADGTFDGSYVSRSRRSDAAILFGELQGLSPMPKVGYEPADAAEAQEFLAQMVFLGWRDGAARFRYRIEDEWMPAEAPCTPSAGGVCEVMGLTLHIVQQGDGAQIALLGQAPRRSVIVDFRDS